MKITAQEEYGLRCLLQLAKQDEGKSLTLKQIAEREGISVANAGKILWILGNAGMVQSIRGVRGGYSLSRPAKEISVNEVIVLFTNQEMEDHCKHFHGNGSVCVHDSDCGIRPVLQTLHEVVQKVLSKITLAQLIQPELQVGQQLFQIGSMKNQMYSTFK